MQYDGYGRSIYDVDAVGNASYPRWSDGIESDQLKWTDTTSTDSSGATVFMRTGHVYDTVVRPTEDVSLVEVAVTKSKRGDKFDDGTKPLTPGPLQDKSNFAVPIVLRYSIVIGYFFAEGA